jgi:hypothetical protein
MCPIDKLKSSFSPLARYPVVALLCCCVVFGGCAGLKEFGRQIAGTSTKEVEESRADSLKQEFICDYYTANSLVRDSLKKSKVYIYRENPDNGAIYIYLSEKDTTAVGIFLSSIDSSRTLVEIASPSTFAKNDLMDKLKVDLKDNIKKEEKKIVNPDAADTTEKKDETK